MQEQSALDEYGNFTLEQLREILQDTQFRQKIAGRLGCSWTSGYDPIIVKLKWIVSVREVLAEYEEADLRLLISLGFDTAQLRAHLGGCYAADEHYGASVRG